MIKYIDFNSIDEYGSHITAFEDSIIKTASNNYSSEIMSLIDSIVRDQKYYYVVMNALGSYEKWGANRNGDAFPESGLRHVSSRSDMKTPNDYGYKTFEYYGHLFLHHVNKDPKRSFGKVFHAIWNDALGRVELIVGIDRDKGADIVTAIENGDIISVSMGCKLKYDRCSICDNKAKSTKSYCKHLKNNLRQMVTFEQAIQWSRETGKNILPGSMVMAWNDYPRFFDISKVHIGAEPTAFVLGKVASAKAIASADIAEAYGVTDEMIDKLADMNKRSEITKEIPSGEVTSKGKAMALRKIIDSKVGKTIEAEEKIPNNILDSIARTMPLEDIFGTMLGLGIHPKPSEFQRIVIINLGEEKLANDLEDNNIVFDPNCECDPIDMDLRFSDLIGRALMGQLEKRNILHVEKRLMEKTAVILEPTQLDELSSLYKGLKNKADSGGMKMMMKAIKDKAWIAAIIGSGVLYNILSNDRNEELNKILTPAHKYEDVLQNTYFSGIEKRSSVGGSLALGAIGGALAFPAAYIANSYNQRSLATKGKKLFPGAGTQPKHMAIAAGAGTAGLYALGSKVIKKLRRR